MSKRTDISQQIRKYLNGELDARAMHQLEQEALNDPFLAEALEGYEKAGSDQEQHLGDIHARLQDRINEKRRRIVLWRTISIAASVLIFLTIGSLWLKNQQAGIQPKRIVNTTKSKSSAPVVNTPPANSIAQLNKKTIPPATSKKSSINTGIGANKGDGYVAGILPPNVADITPNKSLAAAYAKKDSSLIAMQPNSNSLDKVVVIGYGTQKKKDLTGSIDTIKPAMIEQKNVVANGLSGRVAGIQVVNPKIHSVTGTVVAQEDGLPIPGATVRIQGSNTATQTNSNGKFTINSVPDGSTLDIAFIGYDSQHILVHKKDSLTIAMQPNSNSLNEVVVTGYGTKNEDSERPQYQAARPAEGWKALKEYLQSNAVSPDGKTGTVKLSFIVNPNTILSDFIIIKSVSAKTDSAAIELVKNGPKWLSNTYYKPQKVRLRIKFTGK